MTTTTRPAVVFDRYPLEGGYIDGEFKQLYTIDGRGTYEHGGADLLHRTPSQTFRARCVNPSAAPSVVKATGGASTDYGNHVILDHPGTDYWTLYAHLDEIKVKVGDVLQPGDLIGFVGATGFVTGAHLHWEVCQNAAGPTFGAIRETDAQGIGRLKSPTLRDPRAYLAIAHPSIAEVEAAATLEDVALSLSRTSDRVNELLLAAQRNYEGDQDTRASLAKLSDIVGGMPKAIADAVIDGVAKAILDRQRN